MKKVLFLLFLVAIILAACQTPVAAPPAVPVVPTPTAVPTRDPSVPFNPSNQIDLREGRLMDCSGLPSWLGIIDGRTYTSRSIEVFWNDQVINSSDRKSWPSGEFFYTASFSVDIEFYGGDTEVRLPSMEVYHVNKNSGFSWKYYPAMDPVPYQKRAQEILGTRQFPTEVIFRWKWGVKDDSWGWTQSCEFRKFIELPEIK